MIRVCIGSCSLTDRLRAGHKKAQKTRAVHVLIGASLRLTAAERGAV